MWQNFQDGTKTTHQGKFKIQNYYKRETNKQTKKQVAIYLKKLEKLKESLREEIIKIRVEFKKKINTPYKESASQGGVFWKEK